MFKKKSKTTYQRTKKMLIYYILKHIVSYTLYSDVNTMFSTGARDIPNITYS